LNRSIPALLVAAGMILAAGTILAGTPVAAGDKTDTAPPKAETAGAPAADTVEPGKTATEAVTHPSAVPPSEGAVGTGKPPTAEAPPSTAR
jgi:hypothetical protein